MQERFPVPPGICIPVDFFLEAITPYAKGLRTLTAAPDLEDAGQALLASRKIGALLEDLALPPGLLDEIVLAVQPISSTALAVRSSSILEDLLSSSFAGQYQTRLGVVGKGEIERAVLACWRSYFSPNALTARARFLGPSYREWERNAQGIAVLIQPLIDAECAGVCFSVDPVSLDPEMIQVASTWGLGMGVVDGRLPVDTARVRRTNLAIEEINLADKRERLQPETTGGLQRVPVPEELRRIACLPESWLQRIAQFGLAAEQFRDHPQDVEWAIAKGKMWILQSRPITTLSANVAAAVRFPVDWANGEEPRHFWQLEPIHDWAETALLPIQVDFVSLRTEGGQEAVAYAGYKETRWRKAINGRIYIARAESSLDPEAQKKRSAAYRSLLEGFETQGITLWDHWGPEIVGATERLAGFSPDHASGQDLAEHIEDTLAAARRNWMIHTLLPRRFGLEKLVTAYQQISRQERAAAEDEIWSLIQGEESVHSRLVEALYDLARFAQRYPPIVKLLLDRPSDVFTALHEMPEATVFLFHFGQFMAAYGSRMFCGSFGGRSMPVPWREAPELVLEMITAYIPKGGSLQIDSPKNNRERAHREAKGRIEAMCSMAKDSAEVENFRRRLAYARRNTVFLDEHNHYIDQLAEGQFLQAVIYAGRWLARRGDLAQWQDIYWLRIVETLEALRAPGNQDLESIVVARKRKFDRWVERISPASLGLPDPGLPERGQEWSPPQADDIEETLENRLRGQAASRGIGWGRARIIFESAVLPDVAPGDVLVAKYAGPTWTPMLASLSGLVLEGSSIADHVAITAREYGIPAVMGVFKAVERIPEGAWVKVDGTRGFVEWEE